MQYLLKWMSGTIHYKFDIDETITKISKKSTELMGLYLAATSTYCLENKDEASNTKLVKLNTYKLIAEYCQKPESKVKVSGELKKMIEASQNGKLDGYLKL